MDLKFQFLHFYEIVLPQSTIVPSFMTVVVIVSEKTLVVENSTKHNLRGGVAFSSNVYGKIVFL
mgnify:CR=1 FL=1